MEIEITLTGQCFGICYHQILMILWNSFLFVPDRKSTYRGILLMYPIYFNVASGRHCFPQNCFSLDIRHGCAAHVASITIPYSKQFKSFLWYFVWISIQLRLPAMWSAVSNAITFGLGAGSDYHLYSFIKHDFIVLGLGWVHWECVISRQFSFTAPLLSMSVFIILRT